jgi:NAD(P)-dependent dehydrogenase (short-subunit alcohol dehydrogenase family)
MQQVWFITGSLRGFGCALVRAALDAGDRVVASAGRPGQLAEIADRYGDSVLPLALDVTDAAAARAAAAAGAGRFGRLDVVANNAGHERRAHRDSRRR